MHTPLKIVRDDNHEINIKKTVIEILDYYQNSNKCDLIDFFFTMERISRADYNVIRSAILENYDLLFSVNEENLNNISNPIMEAHIYSNI